MIILVMAAALLTAILVVDYLQKLHLLHSVITEYSALEAVIATSKPQSTAGKFLEQQRGGGWGMDNLQRPQQGYTEGKENASFVGLNFSLKGEHHYIQGNFKSTSIKWR